MQVQQVGVLFWRLRRVFKNRKLSLKFHLTNFLLFDALTLLNTPMRPLLGLPIRATTSFRYFMRNKHEQ